jgi:hypothetical protein
VSRPSPGLTLEEEGTTGADRYRLEGNWEVLTSAASGIGPALIDLLGQFGDEHMTVLDVEEPSGPHDRFLDADLSDATALDGPVYALSNNAGVADTCRQRPSSRSTTWRCGTCPKKSLTALLQWVPSSTQHRSRTSSGRHDSPGPCRCRELIGAPGSAVGRGQPLRTPTNTSL